MTDGALDRLAAYPWPGNIRELEAVLEEAMLLQGEGWLRAEQLAGIESCAKSGPPAAIRTVADRGPCGP